MTDQSQLARPSRVGNPRLVLLVLCASAFLSTLDLFIVNVAFADIGRDFPGSSLADVSWVLSAYAIVYAALLVPLGRLSDRYGRKAGFLLGLALFTLSSAAAALSPGLWWLVGFRMLQAAGAAALTPTSLALLLHATAPERRTRAVRIWASSGAVAAALGPVAGGLLVGIAWQWVFLINIPFGIAALVAAVRFVPDSRAGALAHTPDLLAAGVVAVSIGALALGVVKGPDWGWTSAGTVTSFVIALVTLLAFGYRTVSHEHPVIDPALLRVRTFAWSNATAVLFSLAFAAGLLSAVLWMQDVWGYSALKTGLAVAPGPFMVPLFAAISQRVSARIPAGYLAALGCLSLGIGTLVLATSVGAEPRYLSEFLPGWLLTGVGVGFALPTIMAAATAHLPTSQSATGSAVITMSRQIGSVLGISILVAILGTPVGYAAAHTSFTYAWWTMALVSFAGAATALGMSPRRKRVVPVFLVEPVPTVELAASA
jgi:EmrB/QacA subfamily drug resistance transporter